MIYLASASPRRHELLCQAGIAHEILNVPSPPGEDEPRLAGESPDAYVLRTAQEKAMRALHWLGQPCEQSVPNWPVSPQQLTLRPILAADTTVILHDDVLGKPADSTEAAYMLRRLSGTCHEVHTAIVVARPDIRNHPLVQEVSRTQVRFKTLSDDEIQAYCDSGEPMGKAGAYGIQGRAARFVQHLNGSYTGVVGLPLFETAELLKRSGIAI